MDFERELARIEEQLLTEDPGLAEQLDTFGRISPSSPRRRAPRGWWLPALVAVVGLVLAVLSALAADAATDDHEPASVTRHQSG
ncbi:DUF3040 domain-containing protein [Streptomyces sp. NPDC057257]|uniref:DUF3040 domain-containing protein n=1 Tax=Streptomyces sp. NPDC057257 TaxID=3346071 RepID=UPI00363E8AC0